MTQLTYAELIGVLKRIAYECQAATRLPAGPHTGVLVSIAWWAETAIRQARCCERDNNGDGDCDVHEPPILGMLRKNK